MNWLQTSWGSLDTFYAWLHTSIVLLEASLISLENHSLVEYHFFGIGSFFFREKKDVDATLSLPLFYGI